MVEQLSAQSPENASLPEDLVSGLYALIRNHGQHDPEERTSGFQSGNINIEERTIEFFLSAHLDASGNPELLLVSTSPDITIEESQYMRTFDTEVGQLVWDSRLPVEEVRQAVNRIQAKLNSEST